MTCQTCRHAKPHPIPAITHLVCEHPKAYRPHGHAEACVVKLWNMKTDDCPHWVKR
jgi:hypothetical protein